MTELLLLKVYSYTLTEIKSEFHSFVTPFMKMNGSFLIDHFPLALSVLMLINKFC